ncbi:MAG: hypothetical protein AAF215_29380 [Cyanobacteria bacterium P01_A01_bin.123]
MKRLALSLVTIAIASATLAPIANASPNFDQLRRENLDKDQNNFDELREENLDKEDNKFDRLRRENLDKDQNSFDELREALVD